MSAPLVSGYPKTGLDGQQDLPRFDFSRRARRNAALVEP